MRLDQYLAEQGLAPSREKAKALILNGQVNVGEKTVTKPSFEVSEGADVRITGEVLKYVSRGGLKLEKALQVFPIDLHGRICMDIGASTGGFTDCMLQNGAKKVYAVDVGTDQLAEVLRNNPRVISLEQTNIRYLEPSDIDDAISFISIDVSFISLTKVLPAAFGFLREAGECVALIKPQFEAGKENVGKKGVVRSEKVRQAVVKNITEFAKALGFMVMGTTVSPIRGPEGNEEYLLWLKKV